MVRIFDSNKIEENAELSDLLLSAIVPFVFCYFNVVEVIKNQLSDRPFIEKELYVKVQAHVEQRLNGNAAFVHPYCLSLDSIANALHSLVANGCLIKETVTNTNNRIVQFSSIGNALDQMFYDLHKYCSGLKQFNGLANYLLQSKM